MNKKVSSEFLAMDVYLKDFCYRNVLTVSEFVIVRTLIRFINGRIGRIDVC